MDSAKKKKLEELRKKLLSISEEEYGELLDTSNDKEQWQYENSDRMRIAQQGEDNISKRPEVRAKLKELLNGYTNDPATLKKRGALISKAMKAKGDDHHCKREDVRSKLSESAKVAQIGNQNRKGTGLIFVEITEKVWGTVTDFQKSGISGIHYHAKANKPIRHGKLKNKHFQIYDESIHGPITNYKNIAE